MKKEKSKREININGLSDQSIKSESDNKLVSTMYYDALEAYIKTCNTPMTIAIQGEWGSGKSSFMKCVADRIDKKVFYLAIDIWPFSLLNLGDSLSIAVLNYIYSKIVDNDVAKMAEVAKKIAKIGGSYISNKLLDMNALETFFSSDEIDKIISIKENFKKAILKKLNNEKDRAVIFIDNLDRIEPKRAFEILEILKVFFDCDKCVFVLAVDYDVIKQGAAEKYNKEKSEVYFDKIIQLPFNMPSDTYDIKTYIKKLTKDAFGTKLDPIKDDLAEIIEMTVGKNPRTIKRIINAFTIICYIDVKGMNPKDEEVDDVRTLLFILLCIQLASTELYLYIIDKSNVLLNKNATIDTYIDACKYNNIPDELKKGENRFYKNLDQVLLKYTNIIKKVNNEIKNLEVLYNIVAKPHLTLSKSYLMED